MDIARDVATTAAIARGYDDVMVSIRPLDSRLAPAMCDEPLQALPANTTRTLGAVSVGVRCNGTKPWTIYVRGHGERLYRHPRADPIRAQRRDCLGGGRRN